MSRSQMALLEWNDETHSIQTVSLHTYERTPQVVSSLPTAAAPDLRPSSPTLLVLRVASARPKATSPATCRCSGRTLTLDVPS